MADVNIKIDIDADTTAIDRVRAKLRSLCKEVDDCTKTYEKHTTALRDLSSAQEEVGRRRPGKGFDDDGKKANGLTKFLMKLTKFGFKALAIEAAAALVVIGSAGVLFKTGSFLAKGYEAALVGVSYAMAAIVAAGAAAIAAMRQFQAVQFAPAFAKGAINEANPMAAASAGMKMFIDDSQMAVLGTKGLTSAFKTLNDQQQLTGKTTAVFRQLSNYTAGMGGDMEKGTQSMAKFLATFQKEKTLNETVMEAGKELGPNFEKILKESRKKGLSSYEKFAEAALAGELGDTFKLYSGQLDTLNSTVIGRFKQGFTQLKNLLLEVGEPLLGPITEQIPRVMNILEAMILRIRGNVEEIGKGSLLTGLVNAFDKVANWIGKLVTRDIGKAGGIIEKMKSGWEGIARFFERMQDYLRELVPAAEVLGRVLGELVRSIGGKFNDTIQNLSTTLQENEEKFMSFARGIGSFLQSFGEFSKAVTNAIIDSLPALTIILKLLGKFFELLAFVINAIQGFAGFVETVINKMSRGFINVNGAIKTLTGSVIALAAAMMLIGKGGPITNFKKNLGRMTDFGDSKGGKALKKGARGAGRGLMSLGGRAVSMAGGAGGTAASVGGLAIIGASAYGGAKAGGFLSDKLFNDDSMLSKGGGALAGAAAGGTTGALIGAGIGAIFGAGIGAGPGAAIGAVVGSVFGGIKGYIAAGKEKKEAREAADSILKAYSKGLDDSLKKGDAAGIKAAAEKANAEMAKLATSSKYGRKEYEKRKKDLEETNKLATNALTNYANFEAFFGDPDKLNKALEKTGKNIDVVKNGIVNIFEIMREGGEDVASVWSTVMGGFNQKLLEARLSLFDLPLKTIEMQEKVNANQQKLLEGDTNEKTVIEFIKSAYEYALSQTGGDAIKATDLLERTFKRAYGPGGSLESVSSIVKQAADKIGIFDPKILIDQIIATGKLESQGRAIESISGGAITAGGAELQIRKLLASSGKGAAQTALQIDEALNLYAQGNMSSDMLMAALSDPTALKSIVKSTTDRVAREEESKYINRAGGPQGTGVVPSMNQQGLNIGNIEVQVSGFISDEKTAKRIAVLVQQEVAKYQNRAGKTTTPPPSGGRAPTAQ